MLVVSTVCAFAAGCGSSSHSSSVSTTSHTATSTTTPREADVSGQLDALPRGEQATGTLPAAPTSVTPATERAYLEAVFSDAQRFWEKEFSEAGISYARAHLVLFSRAVHSGCGTQSDVGPFYCGANRGIYLDLNFFEALAHHAGVGPFGQAYIVGHEFGHHVQFLVGVSGRVAALDEHDPSGANARSVRVELQADCLAGVWAHSSQARGELSDADLNDALKTAALVGDDFQQKAAGRVVDSAMWTHGSSAQRQHWLKTGFESGRPGSCDTFSSQ